MPTRCLHYLLFAEAQVDSAEAGSWRFRLERVGSNFRFAATDEEPDCRLERLELLAVVRGLEALEAPSRVTLVTRSRYVSRGLRRGLEEWRSNDWHWERFGAWAPVRDADLWQRIDVALQYHAVDCRLWEFGAPLGRGTEPRCSATEGLHDPRGTAAGVRLVRGRGGVVGVPARRVGAGLAAG